MVRRPIKVCKRGGRWYIVTTFLTVGAALALLTAHGHVGQTQIVSPYQVSRGHQIRVALPSHNRPLRRLVAWIRVENMTIKETPSRVTWRFAWLWVRIPNVQRPRAPQPATVVHARLILVSGRRRLLDASFDVKNSQATATRLLPASPPSTLASPGISHPTTTPSQPTQPPTTTTSPTSPASNQPTSGLGTTGSSPPPGPLDGQSPLNWAPPTLTDPTVVTVASGQDPDVLNLNTRRDYTVRLSRTGIHGTVEINGGHNVVLIGGEVTVPSTANQTDNGADDTDTAIYIRGSTGTVHIEGVLIRADADTEFDGIDVNAPEATVQVENVRMEDVYGSMTTEHADVIQTWGGAKALDVDDLTANGDYQGLTISPDLGSVGSADIENVDLTAEPRPAALAANTVGGGIMLWLTTGTTTCQSSPVTLHNVYISDLTDHIEPVNTVWPSPSSGLSCDPTVTGSSVSWPSLPVTGSVTLGAPPDGPFVPEGVAGNSYESPGYLTR